MYRGDPDDGVCFLPTNATKRVLVAVLLVEYFADMEVEQLVRGVVSSLMQSGLCEDALSYCQLTTENCVNIYKVVPVLDVENHLNSN
jgi:hypothetical protein